jgi:hypothetical protein
VAVEARCRAIRDRRFVRFKRSELVNEIGNAMVAVVDVAPPKVPVSKPLA